MLRSDDSPMRTERNILYEAVPTSIGRNWSSIHVQTACSPKSHLLHSANGIEYSLLSTAGLYLLNTAESIRYFLHFISFEPIGSGRINLPTPTNENTMFGVSHSIELVLFLVYSDRSVVVIIRDDRKKVELQRTWSLIKMSKNNTELVPPRERESPEIAATHQQTTSKSTIRLRPHPFNPIDRCLNFFLNAFTAIESRTRNQNLPTQYSVRLMRSSERFFRMTFPR